MTQPTSQAQVFKNNTVQALLLNQLNQGDSDMEPGFKSLKTVGLEPLTMEDIVSG